MFKSYAQLGNANNYTTIQICIYIYIYVQNTMEKNMFIVKHSRTSGQHRITVFTVNVVRDKKNYNTKINCSSDRG